jgi:hypothetical protein
VVLQQQSNSGTTNLQIALQTLGELARMDPYLFNTKAAALLGVVKSLVPSSTTSGNVSRSSQSTLSPLRIQALKVLTKSCTAGTSLVVVALKTRSSVHVDV